MRIIIKKELAFTVVILFAVLAFAPAVDGSMIINNKEMPAQDNSGSSILSVYASSSSYDYGYEAGRLLGSQYKLIDFIAGFSKSDINSAYIENQINSMEKYCPFILEEFKGLSASTHIKLERLVYLQEFLYSAFDRGCTTTASTGPATKNNETFLTQNVDARSRGISGFITRLLYSKLWVKKITMKYKYAFFGIPILREMPVMNEKGLGWGSNGIDLTTNDSRYIDSGPGVWGLNGCVWNQVIMMTCKNVSEVIPFYSGVMKPSTEHGFWNDVWCDSEGNILMVEMTNSYIATVFGNSTDITNAPEGILWHANYHQWLDPNLTGSALPDECPSSKLRAPRARELLEKNYGNITLDVCISICRDHNGGYNPDKMDPGDICRHPHRNDSHFTIKSWIIEPKNLTIYITRGQPCYSRYVKHNLSKIFER